MDYLDNKIEEDLEYKYDMGGKVKELKQRLRTIEKKKRKICNIKKELTNLIKHPYLQKLGPCELIKLKRKVKCLEDTRLGYSARDLVWEKRCSILYLHKKGFIGEYIVEVVPENEVLDTHPPTNFLRRESKNLPPEYSDLFKILPSNFEFIIRHWNIRENTVRKWRECLEQYKIRKRNYERGSVWSNCETFSLYHPICDSDLEI